MKEIKLVNFIFPLIFAVIVWIACMLIMMIGMEYFGVQPTLIFHIITVPILCTILSIIYFIFLNKTTPLITAFIVMNFVIFMDAFLVANIILKSFEMFTSLIGTWIPFASIFLSIFITGTIVKKLRR